MGQVADAWAKRFAEQNESQAVAELINFVLKASGCDLTVTEHDIEDPDGATNRLRDMQFYCRCKAASLFLY